CGLFGGDVILSNISLNLGSRIQYTFKHSPSDPMGLHLQHDVAINADSPTVTHSFFSGYNSDIGVSFHPYAADLVQPQSLPLAITPYGAIQPASVSFTYKVVDFANAESPSQAVVLAYTPPAGTNPPDLMHRRGNDKPQTCPVNLSEACDWDAELPF